MKNKEDGKRDAAEAGSVIPLYFLAEIEDREDRKDRERDDLLNGLKLRRGELVGADTIGRHLEAIFEKGDAPTDQNHFPQGRGAVLEMAVPGECHKNI